MKKYTKNKTYWKYTSLSLGIHFCQSMHSKEFIILKIVKKIKKIEDKNDDDGIKCKLPPAPSLRISRIKIKRNQRWERELHTVQVHPRSTLHNTHHTVQFVYLCICVIVYLCICVLYTHCTFSNQRQERERAPHTSLYNVHCTLYSVQWLVCSK